MKQFLDERHPGRYRIFNLCQEKTYEASKFDGRVRWIPIADHHPPTLRQIKHFCLRFGLRWQCGRPARVFTDCAPPLDWHYCNLSMHDNNMHLFPPHFRLDAGGSRQ